MPATAISRKTNSTSTTLKTNPSSSSNSSGGGNTANASRLVQSGNDYIANLAASLNIGDNDIYGVGPITNGGDWVLQPNNQQLHHPWIAVPRTLQPTNKLMLQTVFGSSYGAYNDYNDMGCKMPQTYLVYTNYVNNQLVLFSNRQVHVLRFKYNWQVTNGTSLSLSTNINQFVGSQTPFLNIGDKSTNWTQFTCLLPTNITTTMLYWTLFVSTYVQPGAQVDAVQFIPVPKPTIADFGYVLSDNKMTVQWNTLPFTYHHLEYATNLTGPWITNTFTPVITNYVANVTYTNFGGYRFFRMTHN
jgi:hypothetical protein